MKKQDVGEADRLYVLYTLEAGKTMALGKGVRKSRAKLAGLLENFMLVDAMVARNQGQGKITGSIVEKNFFHLRKNFEALANAFGNVGMMEKIISGEHSEPAVFGLLVDYLETLDEAAQKESKEKIAIVGLSFAFKLLAELGYEIQVVRCVLCQEKIARENNHFSAAAGGVVCGRCSSKILNKETISENAIKTIKIFLKNSIQASRKLVISGNDLDNLKNVLQKFVDYIS